MVKMQLLYFIVRSDIVICLSLSKVSLMRKFCSFVWLCFCEDAFFSDCLKCYYNFSWRFNLEICSMRKLKTKNIIIFSTLNRR